MSELAVILLAAGNGNRTGRDKCFVSLAGVTAFHHAMVTLHTNEAVGEIVPVVREERLPEVSALCGAWPKVRKITVGGASRCESTWEGLQALAGTNWPYIAVHEAARPFASAELLRTGLALVKEGCYGAVPALSVTDTLYRVNGSNATEGVADRRRFTLAQTPQVFQRLALIESYARYRSRLAHYTDDASLLIADGLQVAVYEGERDNRKLTWPEDLDWARWMLREEHTPVEAMS